MLAVTGAGILGRLPALQTSPEMSAGPSLTAGVELPHHRRGNSVLSRLQLHPLTTARPPLLLHPRLLCEAWLRPGNSAGAAGTLTPAGEVSQARHTGNIKSAAA